VNIIHEASEGLLEGARSGGRVALDDGCSEEQGALPVPDVQAQTQSVTPREEVLG